MFDSKTEDVDLPTQQKHAVRLAKDGLVGLVVMGSNGEAVHLTPSERTSIIKATRSALDETGFKDVCVIAGCTEQSVRGTIALTKDAANAGADHAMILPPHYYRGFMSNDVIHDFYKHVADESPIPVMMYNYPGAVAGVDMDSDLMSRNAQHPNVKGAKFTCANTGKLTRFAAATNAISSKSTGKGVLAAGGMADMTVQTLVSGGSGVIAGTANVIPKFCVQVWNLAASGKLEEAIEKQKTLAHADWVLGRSGIPGTKSALVAFAGYGGVPRRPLPAMGKEADVAHLKELDEAFRIERGL
ncbi:MAG: hypothetical protein Q9162_002706 [Coniocarpon cinnabarinum]